MQHVVSLVTLLAISVGVAAGCEQAGPTPYMARGGGSNLGGDSSVGGGSSNGGTSSNSGGTSASSSGGSNDGDGGDRGEGGQRNSSSPRNAEGGDGNSSSSSHDSEGGSSPGEGGSSDGHGGSNNAEGGSSDGHGGSNNTEGGSSDGRGGSNDANGGQSGSAGGASSSASSSSDSSGGADASSGGTSTSSNSSSAFSCAKGKPSAADIAPGKNGTWGTSSSVAGGVFAYQDVSASAFSVDTTTTPGSIILKASIAGNGYAGYGIYFKDPEKCWDASSYAGGIRMTLGGDLGGATMIFQVQTNNDYPIDSANKKGACTGSWSSGCSLNQTSIATVSSSPSPVEVPWTSLTGGAPKSLENGELLGIQWQVNCPKESTATCATNLTIGKVEFY